MITEVEEMWDNGDGVKESGKKERIDRDVRQWIQGHQRNRTTHIDTE